jgi:hypothetical protein
MIIVLTGTAAIESESECESLTLSWLYGSTFNPLQISLICFKAEVP